MVQIITNNVAAYVAMDKILQDKYSTLFWTPNAMHVLELVLEDISKLDWVR